MKQMVAPIYVKTLMEASLMDVIVIIILDVDGTSCNGMYKPLVLFGSAIIIKTKSIIIW